MFRINAEFLSAKPHIAFSHCLQGIGAKTRARCIFSQVMTWANVLPASQKCMDKWEQGTGHTLDTLEQLWNSKWRCPLAIINAVVDLRLVCPFASFFGECLNQTWSPPWQVHGLLKSLPGIAAAAATKGWPDIDWETDRQTDRERDPPARCWNRDETGPEPNPFCAVRAPVWHIF